MDRGDNENALENSENHGICLENDSQKAKTLKLAGMQEPL